MRINLVEIVPLVNSDWNLPSDIQLPTEPSPLNPDLQVQPTQLHSNEHSSPKHIKSASQTAFSSQL